MSVIDYEQKKLRWLKEKAEGHQQEAKCLESSTSGVDSKDWVESEQWLEFCESMIVELKRHLMEMSREEEEERMEMQTKLEGYEEKSQKLKKMLMLRKRELEGKPDYHQSRIQELHQIDVRLDSSQKRHQDRGTGGFRNSSIISAKSSRPVEQQHLEEHPSMHVISAKKAASAASDDAESNSPTYDLEVIPESIDAPLQLDEEPSCPIRITEVDAKGSFVRFTNILPEDVDVGRFYVAQWRPGGKPSTSFQFPVSVILPGLSAITIWSASSMNCHENPPTDFICEQWLTGEDCTTVVCFPNQQAISWKNQPGRSSQKHRYADGRMEHEQRLMTGSDDIKAKEAENKASSLMKRSRSRSSSYNRKQKQDTAAAAKKKEEMKDSGCSGELADCEDGCEEEEEEDNACEDTSSDDCGDDEDEDDECGAEEEDKLVGCWWGDKRCSLPKTIPGVSIHLDDFITAMKKKTKVPGSDEESACRGREFNKCSSNSSTEADAFQCKGQGKGEGWIPSLLSWFKRDEEEAKLRRCEKCDEKYVMRGCCEDDVSMEGGCCADEKTAAKMKKMRRSGTCCEEEEEEDCVDPCQRTGGRFDSVCQIDPHLPSGGTAGGISLRRGGGGKIESSLGARVPVVKARKPL